MRLPPQLLATVLLCACTSTTTGSNGTGSITPQTFSHAAGTFTGNVTWAAGTHTVSGAITLASGTLTVAAGATLNMAAGSSIVVGKLGSLKLLGTAENRVVVTSQALAPSRGDWAGITIEDGSNDDNTFQNANISYGGTSLGNGGLIAMEGGTALTMTDTLVENSAGYGITLAGDATLTNFTGNSLTHNALGPISLTADSVGQLLAGSYGPNDVNGVNVVSSQVSQTATWLNLGTPYVLAAVNVETLTGQAILTIEAGSTLLIMQDQSLLIGKNGALNLAGTADAHIIVTSQRNPANRGDWGQLSFAVDSIAASNQLQYTDVSYGGGSITPGSIWLESGAQLTMQNSTVTDSSSLAVNVTAGAVLDAFTGNTLINNSGNPIAIDVDSVGQLQDGNNTYSNSGILVVGSQLLHSVEWRDLQTPYVISHNFYVDAPTVNGAVQTLTLDAGTVLEMQEGIGIEVHSLGNLVVNGTPDNLVFFTAQNQLQPWASLRLLSGYGPGAGTPSLSYVKFQYGGSGGHGMLELIACDVNVVGIAFGISSPNSNCYNLSCPGVTVVSGSVPPPACPTTTGC